LTHPARPNLFIVGAPKCGTTALSHWLSTHSSVFVSAKKEPHYFSDEYQLMASRTGYEALFSGAGSGKKWLCEASVWYLYSPSAVPNILDYNPGAHFVAMVRDPIGMVPSMHRQQVYNGNELITDLDSALAANSKRFEGDRRGVYEGYPPDHLAYLHSCATGWQIERLKSLVPARQLHVIVYDDLTHDPELTYRQVLGFLGLVPELPETFDRVNAAKIRRYPALDRFARSMIDFRVRNNIKLRLGITSVMRKLNKMEHPIAPLTPKQRHFLAESFRADTAILEKCLYRSLDQWL
jgi:hypothetical protein